MTKELERIESLEKQAKDEIANLLMLDDGILGDVKININSYRVDIEMYGHYIFVLSDYFGEIKYSTSIYSTSIRAESDKKDRIEYQKIVSVFVKLLDPDVSDKVETILEKYMMLLKEIEK